MFNGGNSEENDFTWLWISLVVTFAITFLVCGCCLCYYILYREETENSLTNPEINTNTSIDNSVCCRKASCISVYNNNDVNQNMKIVPIEPYAEKWRSYQRSTNKSSFEKHSENTNDQLDATIYVQKLLPLHHFRWCLACLLSTLHLSKDILPYSPRSQFSLAIDSIPVSLCRI